ncbi:MAG: prepilin peptidase [Leptospiraceae bacterium]|nr:prepilin peptidase [Leptospiraceae bacterium]
MIIPAPVQYILAILVGLTLGSFYTALASRVLYYFYGPGRRLPQRWKLIFTRPSTCLQCDAPIRFFDLWPIMGFVITRGQCRNCGVKIGWHTLAGEMYPGILFPALLYCGQSWFSAVCIVCFCGHLYIALATDLHFYILDLENTMFLFLWAFADGMERSGLRLDLFSHYALAGTGAFMVFLLLFLAARLRGLGFGDVLLAGTIGLLLGIPWILVAVEIAALAAIGFILFYGRGRNFPAPLGAGLALGVFITLPAWIIYELFARGT